MEVWKRAALKFGYAVGDEQFEVVEKTRFQRPHLLKR